VRRLHQLAAEWGIELNESFETSSSLIGYGTRDGQRVVLKVVKVPNDEWHAGAVLAAFGGRGMVRVLEHVEGAMLLQRLEPGTSLVELVRDERDDDATSILANVIAAMSPGPAPLTSPTVSDWARGFARHRATGGTQIPSALLEKAERTYIELCASQRHPRLLHGDLQHYNVLLDQGRGWVAIDPKGVVGEIEYEVGAAMRNPCELPDVFTNRRIIDARLDRFCTVLRLDRGRVLRWSFAQAVLSAVWGVEDGELVGPDNIALRLAAVLDPMVA
jgi:streptomycin 6-kinase